MEDWGIGGLVELCNGTTSWQINVDG